MSKSVTYTVPIKDLNLMIANNGSNVIKDASRTYHSLLKQNIGRFSKTGGLLASWLIEILDDKHSQIYSRKPYARSQDKGAKIRITKKMRNFAWHMWYKTKNTMWKAIAITKKSFINLPAKHYSKVDLSIIKILIESQYG